jgi:hypothetical protein
LTPCYNIPLDWLIGIHSILLLHSRIGAARVENADEEVRAGMYKALKNPTARDNRALAVFFGISLLCAIYFASGILVSYVSPPSDLVEMARDGKGALLEVTNLPSYDVALQISQQLRQRQLESTIDFAPTSNGYVLRIGPLTQRSMAERLADEMRKNGYDQIGIREGCPGGSDCPPESKVETDSDNPAPSDKRDLRTIVKPIGPTGPLGQNNQNGQNADNGKRTDAGSSGQTRETVGRRP